MSRRRVDHEPGYVLHTYPYKETSLVVEAFTHGHGRVALLARGARRPRSAMRGMLLSFQPLQLAWSGAGELATLVRAEWGGPLHPAAGQLRGRGLMCAFYVNELLLRLLPREDAHEALFDRYAEAIAALSAGAPAAAVLRTFEKRLLAGLGYAPLLDRDASSGAPIDPGGRYRYEPDRGPVRINGGGRGDSFDVSGRTLLDVAVDDYTRPETRDEARQLMRALIGERLHGQVLHTREVLMELNDL